MYIYNISVTYLNLYAILLVYSTFNILYSYKCTVRVLLYVLRVQITWNTIHVLYSYSNYLRTYYVKYILLGLYESVIRLGLSGKIVALSPAGVW